MTKSSRPIHQLTLFLVLGVSVLIAVLIPSAFFLMSYQGMQSSLKSETELTANSVNSIVHSNQKTWRFEELRLSELLERASHDKVPQTVLIRDSENEIVAKSGAIPPSLTISNVLNIYDAGTIVGKIEVYRSLLPLLKSTTMVAFGSISFGAILFFFFRELPLRTIKKAFQTIAESEKKYHSLYETMREGMALHRVNYGENGEFSSLTVIDINPSCAAMFASNGQQIVGGSSFLLFGDVFKEFLSERLMILERGETLLFDLQLPGTDSFFNIQVFSPAKGLVATLLEDITESRKSEQQIQKMAYFDTLTDLPNRALFYDRINQAIANASRDNSSLAVLFLDLDHFKNINDTLGHSIGDELLVEVAQRLNKHIRTSDTLARLGGDEFVVVITRLGEQLNATSVAQKLVDSIQRPFTIKENELHITASVGISLFPNDGTDAETLIRHADMAMYSSKESGRNAFNFFSPIMNQKAITRMENELGLHYALEREEFFLEYQPIICASTGTIAAAEALVRWNHPTRGRIPPIDFITLAEETGMILPLGEWVLRSVCRTMKLWNDAGLPRIRYCVNVSSRQIEQQNFPETVRAVLQETGANASQLEIELTESCLVSNIEKNILDVFGMRKWGITIAIDDFGTGYSSLSYIKTLPIDHIKIDRAFVTDICTNVQDQAIVEAIITMSQKLGINNIAEGVETREQLEFLQAQGCSEIQGYYYHRPLSVEEFEKLLRIETTRLD